MGCHFLLQGIFPTQGLNLGLQHCRQMLYHLSHQGSPKFNLILSEPDSGSSSDLLSSWPDAASPASSLEFAEGSSSLRPHKDMAWAATPVAEETRTQGSEGRRPRGGGVTLPGLQLLCDGLKQVARSHLRWDFVLLSLATANADVCGASQMHRAPARCTPGVVPCGLVPGGSRLAGRAALLTLRSGCGMPCSSREEPPLRVR